MGGEVKVEQGGMVIAKGRRGRGGEGRRGILGGAAAMLGRQGQGGVGKRGVRSGTAAARVGRFNFFLFFFENNRSGQIKLWLVQKNFPAPS